MKAKQILTTVATAIAMSLIGNVAQAQADCPKAGDLKSFAQITAQAEIFNGCDVTTEVNFGSVFTAKDAYASLHGNLDGFTLIYVYSVNGSDIVAIPNDKADSIFTLTPEQPLSLRGMIDYKKIGLDNGNNISSILFRAQSIEVVKK